MSSQRMRVGGRVTIGIPTLNRSDMLIRAVRSVFDQTYHDIELIISDDVSTDDTLQRLDEIKDPRLVVFRQEKRLGLVGNFDFCLRQATGEFFLLLGNDDILMPEAIERLVAPFLNPPEGLSRESIGVVWCPCWIGDAGGNRLWKTQGGPPRESGASLLSELWAGRRGVRFSSILVRTEDAIAAGGYQERYGELCDIGNWGKVALLHDYVVCVTEPVVQYTQHHGSATSQTAAGKWQDWAKLVYSDLVAMARGRGNEEAARKLRARRGALISGITITVLVQTIGKPAWIRNAFREVLRSPGALLTPYVGVRLMRDGWKILRLSRRAAEG